MRRGHGQAPGIDTDADAYESVGEANQDYRLALLVVTRFALNDETTVGTLDNGS